MSHSHVDDASDNSVLRKTNRNTRRRLDTDRDPDDKMHEAPFSCSFLANDATMVCPHGFKRHSMQQINRNESLQMTNPNQLEPSVTSLWKGSKRMAPNIRVDSLFCNIQKISQ